MNMNLVHEPKNRGEQIEGTTRFVLDNDAHYDNLKHNPNRLNACALKLFISGYNMQGYHANVIRKALQELETTGMIDNDAPPYEMD